MFTTTSIVAKQQWIISHLSVEKVGPSDTRALLKHHFDDLTTCIGSERIFGRIYAKRNYVQVERWDVLVVSWIGTWTFKIPLKACISAPKISFLD